MIRKILILGLLIAASSTFAQGMGHNGKRGGGPCHEDREKFCKDMPKGKGEGKMHDCLMKNIDSVSSACKEHLNKMNPPKSN
ncbi:hypothetical protein EHQ27_15030 [Leptospira wolffii]|uniref:Cys-rich protein n=1 Tax=Leptospira wolffii TaxID=409998 RepID=A0A2M9ZH82_9LEPT|nr:cysteine rich repeat-containing protein [Leptospira wolffii]PJZ67799.1 hypothetical protein CH371_07350 [Leptospira wolffii]TGK62808.1 hypothetical protein EHQ32_08400 [Leptospira wolffii]TGK67656.1 hypothetical protein EHQ27_15030 [Leptospira wolffii]TGK73805.1 hypothetical protein EHQ35_05365 [Leptospira wolffii]TGL28667.1 hypothetical protein EHQ57_11890 [Leptospira wolffii]